MFMRGSLPNEREKERAKKKKTTPGRGVVFPTELVGLVLVGLTLIKGISMPF